MVAALYQRLNQLSLAQGNTIFICLLTQRFVFLHALGQNRSIEGCRIQNRFHLCSQLLLQRRAANAVAILHGNQDRIGQFVHIPVLQQRTNQGIDSHIGVSPFELQPLQNLLAVTVEGNSGNDTGFSVQLQFLTGVYIHGNNAPHQMGLRILHASPGDYQRKARGSQPRRHAARPAVFYRAFLLCHILRSFLRTAAGENVAHRIRRSMFNGAVQMAYHFLFCHRASSPFQCVFNFFSAR